MNTTRTIGRASQPVEVYFDDWREIGGVKYPFSISQNSTALKLAFTVKEIRQNVAIDAKLFQAPGALRDKLAHKTVVRIQATRKKQ